MHLGGEVLVISLPVASLQKSHYQMNRGPGDEPEPTNLRYCDRDQIDSEKNSILSLGLYFVVVADGGAEIKIKGLIRYGTCSCEARFPGF